MSGDGFASPKHLFKNPAELRLKCGGAAAREGEKPRGEAEPSPLIGRQEPR